MAVAADFQVVTDAWVVEGVEDTISFQLPSNINTRLQGVLGFMLEVDNADDLTLTLRLNGFEVWTWKYPEGRRIRFFQEVIGANVLRSGTNVFSFDTSSGDLRFTQLSDVVVWFKANI